MLIPEENKKDLKEIPANIRNKLDIRPMRWIDEIYQAALTEMPTPADFDDNQPLDDAAAAGKIPTESGRSSEIQRH